MEGLTAVWNVIGAFFDALPSEIVMVASYGFVGAIILGLLGWFK